MKATRKFQLAAALGLSAMFGLSEAQEVVLKIHHFLPPQATIQAQVFVPWCEKIGKESGGKLKCQIYPSMQLGGTPPQLFDQARDGVADIIWTIPTYQAGRFTKSEVFELPFMARNAEIGSPALWEYIQKNSLDEFKGTKLLAAHLHDGSLLHFTNKRVTNLDELKGLKVRAPTRIGTKFLTAIGAVPVQMPVPQVTESLSKGVIDGAMVPWEVAPALKLQEVTKYHLDNAASSNKMSNSIFVIAMNQAKYDRRRFSMPTAASNSRSRSARPSTARPSRRRNSRLRRAACSTRCRRPSWSAGRRRPSAWKRSGSARSRPRAATAPRCSTTPGR
jgi:TRAP-type C4-dicarboxylate transport system substrate-binding protein